MSSARLDFGVTPIPQLFFRLFIPTLLSMISSAVLNVADGAFVGRGVNSDALAAINIAAPVFLISTGIALLLGSGASVISAIQLSQGSDKAARMTTTNTFCVAVLLLGMLSGAIYLFKEELCYIFGGSEMLMPYVTDYLFWISPAIFGLGIVIIGMFMIRLDGSPTYAMLTNVIPSLTNIVLDYIFVFPLEKGIAGAAMATLLAEALGVLMVVVYFVFRAKRLRLARLMVTAKSVASAVRGFLQIAKVGMPTFVGETAISVMMIAGNYMFISRLGEDGVAAFSVACYLMPAVFMFGNSIAQSILPIISYNYGQGNMYRVGKTIRLSLVVALVCGALVNVLAVVYPYEISSLFLDASAPALAIVSEGLPLFAFGFSSLTMNVVIISSLQSLMQSKASTVFMLLRGYIFIIPTFYFVPMLLDVAGLWLAVPASELLTLVAIGIWYFCFRRR